MVEIRNLATLSETSKKASSFLDVHLGSVVTSRPLLGPDFLCLEKRFLTLVPFRNGFIILVFALVLNL